MGEALSDIVAITKTDNVYDEGKVSRCVRNALDLLGGIGKFVKSGDKVLLKPNFVAPRPQQAGATTDLRVLEEVVNEVMDSAATPIIAEGSGLEFNTDLTFKTLGVKNWTESKGIKLVNIDREELMKVKIDDGFVLREILIPRIIKEADVLINVPKMKTHVLASVSFGLKNIMGLLPYSEKRKMHTRGLGNALIDLSKVIIPNLTIVDGIIAMEGEGGVYGDPVDLGVIVSGKNVSAVDYVCCNIVCVEPREVAYLKRALDSPTFRKIRVVGEDIDSVKRPFKLPKKGVTYQFTYQSLFYLDAVLSKIIRKKTILPTIFRHFGTRPKIESKKCPEGCRQCLDVCPTKAINEKGNIRTDLCVRCLFCYDVCRHNAVKILGHSKPLKKTDKNFSNLRM